jgi:hypothetical protein
MSEARKTVLDNRYDVVRPLGGGGMGEVFLARDRVLGRDVAVKVLRSQYAGDSEFAERFRREARSAASLSHPNIVQVYDRGETEDGASYIAMEYVPGGTLTEKITRQGPLGAEEAAALGAQVAEALGAAHERGMVHRDVKPQNVLLTARDGAKVADFGIARAGSSVTISKTGSVMGTAGYMSPEQALGKPATLKSDLYSLGVVLYEALTGELPYKADNPIAVSMKHVNEPLFPPREIDPTIPEDMNALVTKLMAKNPDDRYASAGELADDLWRMSRGLRPVAIGPREAESRTQPTVVAAPEPTSKMPPARLAPVRRRRSLPWFLILVAVILFFLGTLGVLQAALGPNATNGWFDVFGERNNPPGQLSAPAKVRVPDVARLPTAQARQELTDAGLKVGQITSFPSNSVGAGRVIAPDIAAGTPVDRGTEVNLSVSSGPQPVSSASPSASVQPSPAPAATADSSASAQAAQQGGRRPVQSPAATEKRPKAKVPKGPAPRSPNPSAPAVGNSGEGGLGGGQGASRERGVGRNSGNGSNSGSGGNSGPGGGGGSGKN